VQDEVLFDIDPRAEDEACPDAPSVPTASSRLVSLIDPHPQRRRSGLIEACDMRLGSIGLASPHPQR
jgi:hypothetical protein